MKDVTMLLTEKQRPLFVEEEKIEVIRERIPDNYGAVWFAGGQAEWTGFMDDQGDFVPVDWC